MPCSMLLCSGDVVSLRVSLRVSSGLVPSSWCCCGISGTSPFLTRRPPMLAALRRAAVHSRPGRRLGHFVSWPPGVPARPHHPVASEWASEGYRAYGWGD
eukprot:908010-Prymnesium_polylepis.2